MLTFKHFSLLIAIGLFVAACSRTATNNPTPEESTILPPSGKEALETPSPPTKEASTVTPLAVLPKLESGANMSAMTPLLPTPPGREAMQRGRIFPDKAELLIMESYPIQVTLLISGALATPCHLLQVDMSPPDADNRIMVEVYSLVDPTAMCIQVLEPFEQRLFLGSFSAGKYSVWVNGQKVGEFDS